MKSIVTWFEIPALDVDRAILFYETILALEMHKTELGGVLHAFFPHEGEAIGGAIVKEEGLEPGTKGPLVYLNGGNDLQIILDRIENAGGKIILPKTLISEQIGYMAQFIDTEGNRLAIYEAIGH